MNYETIELNTKRLKIKKGELRDFLIVYEYNFSKLTDVDDIFELEKQDLSKITKWFVGGMEKYYKKASKNHVFDWIVYLNNEPIGNILTENENLKKNSIELTFNLHPKYWGNGYMKEALDKVMEYLYSIGYEYIICSYSEGNKKTKRLVEKIGFKPYKIETDAFESKKGNKIDNYKLIMSKDDFLSRTGRIDLKRLI